MTVNEFGHGGYINRLAREAGLRPDQVLDFSANINPLGPPEWFRSLISSQLSSLVHYPDPECIPLVEAIAEHYRTDPQEIVVGNGSSELLYLLPQALPVTKALIAVPAYIDYARAAQIAGLPIQWHSLKESAGFKLDLETVGGPNLRGRNGHPRAAQQPDRLDLRSPGLAGTGRPTSRDLFPHR